MPASNSEWSALMADLERIGNAALERLPDPDDPLARARLCQLMLRELAVGYVAHVYHDREHPEFAARFNALFRWQFPNPDDVIQIAPVDDRGTYRISGRRGTVHFASIQLGSGQLAPFGTGSAGPGLAEHSLDSLPLGPDGSFEVVLSPARPPEYTGCWWPLDRGATHLVVRQRHYDWLESSARLAIERLDRPPERPSPSAEQLLERFTGAAALLERHVGLALAHPLLAQWRAAGYVNRVHTREVTESGRCVQHYYTRGLFDLDEGEALLLEAEIPPGCTYWCFQLGDELACTLDYTYRQSTLNGRGAALDDDGKFRAVVCPEDPGLHNWLDSVGRRRGLLLGRWQGCARAPEVTARPIHLDTLREQLPASTRWVTPAQRREAIRRRTRLAQMRHKW